MPMGAGRSPPGPEQKPDPGRLREAGALRLVDVRIGPLWTERRARTFAEVSSGWLLLWEGSHLAQEIPASLP